MDEEKLETVFLEMISDPESVIILHDSGTIGGHIMTPYFNNTIIAQELFWFARSDGESLLKAFEAWAYIEGAELVSMAGTGIRPKALSRYYRIKGYEPKETFFVKVFN